MSQRTRVLSARWRGDLEKLCELHGLTLDQAMSKQRFRIFVDARSACYRYLRSEGWSYPEIGGLFGRDHTSISYAISDNEERKQIHKQRARASYNRMMERTRAMQ